MKKEQRYTYRCNNPECRKTYVLLKRHHLVIKSQRSQDTSICGKCMKGELKFVSESIYNNPAN